MQSALIVNKTVRPTVKPLPPTTVTITSGASGNPPNLPVNPNSRYMATGFGPQIRLPDSIWRSTPGGK